MPAVEGVRVVHADTSGKRHANSYADSLVFSNAYAYAYAVVFGHTRLGLADSDSEHDAIRYGYGHAIRYSDAIRFTHAVR